MKKAILILAVLLVGTSLFAYQGNQGIGFDVYFLTTNSDATTVRDSEFDMRLFYSIMLNEAFEIAPYAEFSYFKEETGGTTSDGDSSFGFGSMFNWHFVRTGVITLATGVDASLAFGKANEEVYVENSNFTIDASVPIILDVNLGRTVVLRISQTLAGLRYYSQDFSGTKYSSFRFYATNGFGPNLGMIFTF